MAKIIYPNGNGGIMLIVPASDCGIPVEEIARKDVPAGLPFLILNDEDVPEDFTFFAAWEADFSEPHGDGIGSASWFIKQYEAEIAAINAAPTPERGEEQTNEEHAAVVAQWEVRKAVYIEQLNNQIATQQAEMAA